jgi:hypothetical protein
MSNIESDQDDECPDLVTSKHSNLSNHTHYHDDKYITYDDAIYHIDNCVCRHISQDISCNMISYMVEFVLTNEIISIDLKIRIFDYYVNSICCDEYNFVNILQSLHESNELLKYFVLEYIIVRKKYDPNNTLCYYNFIFNLRIFELILDNDSTIDLQLLLINNQSKMYPNKLFGLIDFLIEKSEFITYDLMELIIKYNKINYVKLIFEKQGLYSQEIMNVLITKVIHSHFSIIKLLSSYGANIDTKYMCGYINTEEKDVIHHIEFLNFIEQQNLSIEDKHKCILRRFC